MPGAKDLPLAPGERHLKAFARLGWRPERKTKGSHVILEKAGHAAHLCIPCHKGKDVKRNLLHGQLKLGDISIEAYCSAFK